MLGELDTVQLNHSAWGKRDLSSSGGALTEGWMGKQRGQRKLYQTQHLCSWEMFKKLGEWVMHSSWSLKDITEGEKAYFSISCTLFWPVNFQLNSKWNTCSANQLPHKISKRQPTPPLGFWHSSQSSTPTPILFLWKHFPNTKYQHICHKDIMGAKVN